MAETKLTPVELAEAARRLAKQREASGRQTVLDIFASILPREDAGVYLPAEIATSLRAAFASSGLYQGKERGQPQLSTEPHKPGVAIARSVMLPEQLYADLLNALNMPNIVSEPYGSCSTCLFVRPDGRDRGYGNPCVGCGTGHPCHTPAGRAALKDKQDG